MAAESDNNTKTVKEISVILPIYNGELIIQKNLEVLDNYLKSLDVKYEIIIVDDGSTDKTIEAIKSSGISIKLLHQENQGKGSAFKSASKNIKYQYTIFLDSDLPTQLPMSIIQTMVEKLKDYDIVIGSRYLAASKVKRRASRLFWSKSYRLILAILFHRLNISDTDMGLKAFRTEVFQDLCKKTKEDRWSWDLEMLLHARKANKKIKEVPVEWIEQGSSTFGNFIGPLRQAFTTISVLKRFLFF